MSALREELKKAKRIVVKVGSSTITYPNGKCNYFRIDRLARELSDLQNQGKEMILVTSGAVAVGVDRLGLSEKPKNIPAKQACAAVGQGLLMHTYEKFFAEYGQVVAQVLVTRTEMLDRHRYTNARNTFMELLKKRVIPIVNENDVVALDELKIGDNDNLSAMVASVVDADLVVILSDVDGLYTANPQTHPDATLRHCVEEITPEIEASAGGAGSSVGTGGMCTKIQAAKSATTSGINLVIASGSENDAVMRILNGEEIGTLFVSPGLRVMDSPDIPEDIIGGIKSLGEFYLNTLRKEKDIDWVFFSPAASIAPGERTGNYRLGKDFLIMDSDGKSSISVQDYAKAMIDEFETPRHHRERFTIGY